MRCSPGRGGLGLIGAVQFVSSRSWVDLPLPGIPTGERNLTRSVPEPLRAGLTDAVGDRAVVPHRGPGLDAQQKAAPGADAVCGRLGGVLDPHVRPLSGYVALGREFGSPCGCARRRHTPAVASAARECRRQHPEWGGCFHHSYAIGRRPPKSSEPRANQFDQWAKKEPPSNGFMVPRGYPKHAGCLATGR